jgi:hypothetical protein
MAAPHLGGGFREIKSLRPHQAHACHPSYSGGRNQKDGGSKPALGK